MWQHEQAGSSERGRAIHVGPFGLHPVAVAKFGYPPGGLPGFGPGLSTSRQSTLWLEYYCALGDSSQSRSWPSSMGPGLRAAAAGWSEVTRGDSGHLEGAKKDPASWALRARFVAPSSTSRRHLPRPFPRARFRSSIPRYERYTGPARGFPVEDSSKISLSTTLASLVAGEWGEGKPYT